jgi:hypothetical protein
MAWGLAAAAGTGMAQTLPAPSDPASAPAATPPAPRHMTPTELRESATMPGELRPADAVTPQIVIPLRKDTAPARNAPGVRRPAAAASAGIDDGAARCEASASRSARERCLKARANPTRPL